MVSFARTKAERQFAASLKKDRQVIQEHVKQRQERAAKMARLKALRLAKEAAEKETGGKAAKPAAE